MPSTSGRIVAVVKPRENEGEFEKPRSLARARESRQSRARRFPDRVPAFGRDNRNGETGTKTATCASERALGDETALFADAIKALGSAQLGSAGLATPNRIMKRWKNAPNSRANLNNNAKRH